MKKISFCIPTAKNELEYLKLLFESLETNINNLKDHEVIVFIDTDNQGTLK